MSDPRPRPWTLAAVSVFAGWRVMWERWIWDWREECWDDLRTDADDPHVYADRESAQEAIARLQDRGVASPNW